MPAGSVNLSKQLCINHSELMGYKKKNKNQETNFNRFTERVGYNRPSWKCKLNRGRGSSGRDQVQKQRELVEGRASTGTQEGRCCTPSLDQKRMQATEQSGKD